MTVTLNYQPTPKRKSRLNLWFEQIMVILILLNYLLVLFDLSYVPYHDFWQQGKLQVVFQTPFLNINVPEQPIQVLPFNITNQYDWVKGIAPHRESVQYLAKVDELNNILNQQMDVYSADSQNLKKLTEESEYIFADLRTLSEEMIKQNPFEVANKTGTLERIKNRMRQHIYETTQSSADTAFQIFWSRDHFINEGFRKELDFFEQEIRPLIQTNYFRPLGENGKPLNHFWLLDLPFITIFFLEFLMRSWIISRHYQGVTWFEAMLWRWYDIFLFLPILQPLRIIPLTIRLNQAKLINLQQLKRQASRGFVAILAEDLIPIVVIRVINQIQASISQGEIQKFLRQRRHQEHQINDYNEIAEIFKLFFQITVHKIIPKIKPDAEALLKYNFEKALAQSSMYQHLQLLPGMKNLENQIGEQFSTQLYQAFSETLIEMAKDDPKFNQLLEQLLQTFNQTMEIELQGQKSINQLETLVTEFLEEFKINYVKPLSAEDLEIILEQTRILRQAKDLTLVEPTLIRRVR
ncbi:hypothetical protein C7H19_02730 [Aphanothece hegewaldii CCALA 016]|uniref:Uncharacterized protein n=1 Tax=Aphanothece hegewaldii CCALA 016 TaxID=2107694 RepID=A0A2T1M2K5_9CHRO|nr:hypothetical protein [Aphanothece hegewaldii]PSF38986.1 hypothetical protein C7H19_02730 [Aphanothece hegewaldii CCALA 016]